MGTPVAKTLLLMPSQTMLNHHRAYEVRGKHRQTEEKEEEEASDVRWKEERNSKGEGMWWFRLYQYCMH